MLMTAGTVIVMMSMIMRFITGPRSRLTVMAGNPFGITIKVMLFLPNRNAMLDLINNVPTGPESRIPVRRRYTDPDSHIPDPKCSRAMHRHSVADLETGQSFLDDPFAFLYGQRGISLIFKTIHSAALIAVPHPSLKRAEPSGFRQMQTIPQRIQIDWRIRHQKVRHPPVTGGMNTT
ncbi:hypothetical protein AA3271_0866 [Gluconobacter japonicus NBRC 3271]|nr:hypothetical protein AA3271_0866 [Gluconobacter japonicus NBRC 3271]